MYIYLRDFDEKKMKFTRQGVFVIYFYNVSGEVEFDIATSGVSLSVFGLYQGNKKERFFLKTTQHHSSPDSSSDVLVKSVMDGDSEFIYSGLIRIKKESTGTHAYQKNTNLMLSRSAKVVSQPFLEILTDSVFCTHGSTTGPVDTASLQYLETRGISLRDGQKLLVDGFITDLYNRIRMLEPDALKGLKQFPQSFFV